MLLASAHTLPLSVNNQKVTEHSHESEGLEKCEVCARVCICNVHSQHMATEAKYSLSTAGSCFLLLARVPVFSVSFKHVLIVLEKLVLSGHMRSTFPSSSLLIHSVPAHTGYTRLFMFLMHSSLFLNTHTHTYSRLLAHRGHRGQFELITAS